MYSINITDDNTIRYPLHVHQQYEVMVYLEGVGYLETDDKRYPFSPGSIIIVPPRVKHGSVSKNGFRNISIKGSFYLRLKDYPFAIKFVGIGVLDNLLISSKRR